MILCHSNKKKLKVELKHGKFFLLFAVFFYPLLGWTELIRSGTLVQNEHWTIEQAPVFIKDNLQIPETVTVTVDPGVEIQVNRFAVITVLGKLDALGNAGHPIQFHSRTRSRWGAISFERNGTGTLRHCTFDNGRYAAGQRIGVVNVYQCSSPVVIDSCTFTRWPDEFNAKAVQGYNSPDVVVRNCWFGPGTNEAVHGVHCPMLVEYNTFDQRFGYSDAVDIGTTQNPGPVIRYNVFLGSEDDAIDLDDCDAYVEGNWVMNCRGGSHDPIGISGDRDSHPVIVNNVVINCESGIGFKNGADILVVNNTIVDCDRGIWLHQNPAHATVVNTIIWGSEDQQSIQLERGSTIQVIHSIIRGDAIYPGDGNLNLDPKFVDAAHLRFQLQPDSPAIDAGQDEEHVLNGDYDGIQRFDIAAIPNTGKGQRTFIDMGAYEYQPIATRLIHWNQF